METIKRIRTPLTDETVRDLRAGDRVLLSGVLYTARDEAHQRMTEALAAGKELPVDLRGQVVYYAGPAPAKPGQVIGSCGPTTSSRMDPFTPALLRQTGLKGMLGKGPRSQAVVEAMRACTAVYLAAVGGAGVLISQAVKRAEVVAYGDLAACAVRRLEVEDLPCVVAIDCAGEDLYRQGVARYRQAEPGEEAPGKEQREG